jgi:hypothetical protein
VPERALEAFREEAERLTPMPAFVLIEAAGRRRRRMRRVVAALAAACVLAVVVMLAGPRAEYADVRAGAGDPLPRPVDDLPRSAARVMPWPGPTMTTLRAGTYELWTAAGTRTGLAVDLTVPPGWNAWWGPNRFEGLGTRVTQEEGSNERVLAASPDWYVGLLVLEVRSVAHRGCSAVDVSRADTGGLVRALLGVPDLDVVDGPVSTVRSGHGAVHVRLRQHGQGPGCWRDLLLDAPDGTVGFGQDGTVYDASVIDVNGQPVLVWASWTRDAPAREVDALLGIVDSVDVHDPGYPTEFVR